MKLEWKDGPIPSDAPDGKYLVRQRSGDEIAGLKRGCEFTWTGQPQSVLEAYKATAHAFLEPLESPSPPAPPVEVKPFPMVARWVEDGRSIAAVRIDPDDERAWRMAGRCLERASNWLQDSDIPADAERIDITEKLNELAALRARVEELVKQLNEPANVAWQVIGNPIGSRAREIEDQKLREQLATVTAENQRLWKVVSPLLSEFVANQLEPAAHQPESE